MYLHQKHGKWYVRISYYDEFGKRRMIERAGSESKRDTEKLGRELQAQIDKGKRSLST